MRNKGLEKPLAILSVLIAYEFGIIGAIRTRINIIIELNLYIVPPV